MILAFITPFFIWINTSFASPLDKSIEITFVYDDNTPIVGLPVELHNGQGFLMSDVTNEFGKVLFAGLEDETYTWKWSWQNIPAEHSEEIDCSELVWYFTEPALAYWSIEKTFVYDVEPYGPVKDGLEVILRDPKAIDLLHPIDTQYTVDGKVTFKDLKAGEYTLEWVWGGDFAIEFVDPILFQTPTPWTKTNKLEPKSGGG